MAVPNIYGPLTILIVFNWLNGVGPYLTIAYIDPPKIPAIEKALIMTVTFYKVAVFCIFFKENSVPMIMNMDVAM